MEALEHQAGILFRTLILAYITGHDVPYLSGEALAGLVQIRDEMGILTRGNSGELMFPAPFKLHTFIIRTGFPRSSLACSIHARHFFLLLIMASFCQYAAQPVHGNLLIHVLAPGLG